MTGRGQKDGRDHDRRAPDADSVYDRVLIEYKTLAVRVRGSVPRWIHLVPSTVTQARFGPIWFLESCARWTAKERGAMAARNRVAARAGGPDAGSRRAGIHDDASAKGEA